MLTCTCGYVACTYTCWYLPSNQSFYRQFAGYRKGVGDYELDQSWTTCTNKIGLVLDIHCKDHEMCTSAFRITIPKQLNLHPGAQGVLSVCGLLSTFRGAYGVWVACQCSLLPMVSLVTLSGNRILNVYHELKLLLKFGDVDIVSLETTALWQRYMCN